MPKAGLRDIYKLLQVLEARLLRDL